MKIQKDFISGFVMPKTSHIFTIDVNNGETTKNNTWYKRLWIITSNPFYYVFYGKLRF